MAKGRRVLLLNKQKKQEMQDVKKHPKDIQGKDKLYD